MEILEIKNYFENSHTDNAVETMRRLINDEGLSPENQELLFNFTFKELPNLGDDYFCDFVSALGIISPDENYYDGEEYRDCTIRQFFLRKILIAAAIENVQSNIDSVILNYVDGYYDDYFIEPSSPYKGNGLFIHNSEVEFAIQEIIESKK